MQQEVTQHSTIVACPAPTNSEDDICSNLLAPLQLGQGIHLLHRIVLAPLTRCRALDYVPQPAHVEYYTQRATVGGLLITEAVAISQQGIGFPHSPGIWTDQQVEGWHKVVQAVHDRGAYIFCQLWHVGRASHIYYQTQGAFHGPISSTSQRVPDPWQIRLPDGIMADFSEPRALQTNEIPMLVKQFSKAAQNAKRAGFDGVEVHGAHGYLVDQFLKDGINDRKDEYGGSVENRCRFALDVVAAVAAEMGEQRTAIRISPVNLHNGAFDSNPKSLALHLISELNHMDLTYLHVSMPHLTNDGIKPDRTTENGEVRECMHLLREAYNGKLMLSGGFDRHSGMQAIRDGYADLISYGRMFISNPDLPLRYAIDAGLNPYDRSTFYTHHQVQGYVDYPTLSPNQTASAWAKKQENLGLMSTCKKKKRRPWNFEAEAPKDDPAVTCHHHSLY